MEGSDVPVVIAVILGAGYLFVVGAFVWTGIRGLRGRPITLFSRAGTGPTETGLAARIIGGVYLLIALLLLYPLVRAFISHSPGT